MALAFLYGVFAVGHLFAVPPHARPVMFGVAALTGGVFAAFALVVGRRPVPPPFASPALAGMIALVLLNSTLHLVLVDDPIQTTNLVLLLIGAGVFMSSRAWLAVVAAAVYLAWALVAWGHRFAPPWPHFGFALLTGTVVAAAAYEVRRRYAMKLERLLLGQERDRDALRGARDELELRVAERTRELQSANERLRAENAERRRAESELKAAKEAAEAADRTKSEFLSIASHELRTPLTSLQLSIQQSLRRGVRGEPVGAATLERMQRQASRLALMVEDLLDASRLENGRIDLHRARFDLRVLLTEVVEAFRDRAPRHPVELELPEGEAPVDADPMRIEQVLANLLDNAFKYSPEGSRVIVRLALGEGWSRVSVSDEGPGIAREQRSRIFTRFYRAYTAAQLREPGLGLGLYVSRALVERHGGRLDLEAADGRGSTFWFALPLAFGAEAHPPPPQLHA